jgi:plastocyanin
MQISATRSIVPVLIVTALTVGGCGGAKKTASPSTSSSGAGGGATLSLQADPSQLKFDKSALSAKAGKVTIAMKNPSQVQHDVAIEGNGVNVVGTVVGNGGTSTASASLKAGTYTFFCSVDGHRQAGMEGTLTVK